MATRMKDIAQRLNVSTVTVSKVLNNDRSISEATRQRVLDTARELGYRTNLAAKGLVTGQSRMIGLIVPDLFHGFFSEIAGGMSDILRQQGYGLIIASSRDDQELERQEVQQMLARSVDALVVASCEPSGSVFDQVARELPLILLDRRLPVDAAMCFVGTDDVMAGRLAAQHLLDIGRKRIAFIGVTNSRPCADREQGLRDILDSAGISLSAERVTHLSLNEESTHVLGALSMGQLLALDPRPDAVFCFNDPAAMGAMAAILEAGLRIPDDIALIGCGNPFYSAYLAVPLSSIDQKAPILGEKVAKSALSAIQFRLNKSTEPTHDVSLEPSLVIRKSTVAPS